MNKTQKIDLVYNVLKKHGYDMEKIDIFYNKNEMLVIKDYTYTHFINGVAVLNTINYYKKIVKIDVLKPNYLIHETLSLKYKEA